MLYTYCKSLYNVPVVILLLPVHVKMPSKRFITTAYIIMKQRV